MLIYSHPSSCLVFGGYYQSPYIRYYDYHRSKKGNSYSKAEPEHIPISLQNGVVISHNYWLKENNHVAPDDERKDIKSAEYPCHHNEDVYMQLFIVGDH